jgi:hypothetical protein
MLGNDAETKSARRVKRTNYLSPSLPVIDEQFLNIIGSVRDNAAVCPYENEVTSRYGITIRICFIIIIFLLYCYLENKGK